MSEDLSSLTYPFAPLIGVAPLLRRAFFKEDLTPLASALLARAQQHPTDANAYLDCSTVLQLMGDRDTALALQAQAIKIQPLYSLPAQGEGPGIRVLVLMGLGDLMANTPIEFLVENSDVSLDLLYLTLDSDWPEVVPEHDVMLVAVAESDDNQPLLQRIAAYVSEWPRPIINLPERIAVLSRDGVYAALRDAAGTDVPQTARVDRALLQSIAAGEASLKQVLPQDEFPVILRPTGSHAGQNLEKILNDEGIADYLRRVEGDHFYMSRFVDYRSADGLYRKYRVALIDGRPYLCHFAVSSHWMIHYLNAGMGESAEKRAEEAECMAHFEETFAVRHARALAEIFQRIGLSYLGIDCAETRTGDLLIFEVDNAMIVHDMDPEDIYPYKKPAMRKVFNAFRALLETARQSVRNG